MDKIFLYMITLLRSFEQSIYEIILVKNKEQSDGFRLSLNLMIIG